MKDMDREPFAVFLEDLDDNGFVVWIKGQKVRDGLDPHQATSLTAFINAAYEARVKEAVRNAVEEFRQEAIFGVKQYADNVKEAVCFLRQLPAEPEGKP